MPVRPAPTTAAELVAAGDDGRYEIVAGVPRERPGGSLAHAMVHGRLCGALVAYTYTGETGVAGPALTVQFAANPDTVLVPDVAFIRADKLPVLHREGAITTVVPDLVAEVLDARDTTEASAERVAIYVRAGVRLVWIVNPKLRSVTIYAADGTVRSVLPGDVLDGGDVLPGFALPVDRIFA